MSFPDREEEPGDGPSPSGSGPSNQQLGWLAVAALVVVVIAVVIIVISSSGSGHPGQNADANATGTVSSTPSFTQTVEHPTTSSSSVTTSPASGGALTPAGGPVPAGFQPASFTAVSDTVWWVMGSASCSSPPCESIVRTANGGQSFVGIPAPRSDTATNLRFANLQDGYAYGGSQLWSTHDGGSTWNPISVSGTVQSLSTADGYVYAGTSQGLLRSPVGVDSFQQIESGDIPNVWTQGTVLYADSQGTSGTPALLTSTNHGGSFQQYGAPEGVLQCSFSSTGDGIIWAPCATGMDSSVWRSSDGGSHWDAAGPTSAAAGQPNSAAFAAASTETAVYGSTQLERTTDGGQSWAQVSGFPGSDETVVYLGFSDPTHGVAIVDSSGGTESRSALYDTVNGGVSYTPVSITAG